jgi:hypothetical protein
MRGSLWIDLLPNRTCCLNLELLKIGRDSTAWNKCPEELLPQEAWGETLVARPKHKGRVTSWVIKREELHAGREPSLQGQLYRRHLERGCFWFANCAQEGVLRRRPPSGSLGTTGVAEY